ncbi:hypothetical protein FOCC_FOCC002837 [Frankliniella occidentalis]|nr:hypothetical protein FOCC_FOCC002837 [Frankliniella occidentalis]
MIVFADLIKPIRLPTEAEGMQKHHGLRGQLSGWGATHNSGPQHPQLKWARLPVSQPGTCPQLNGAPYAHTQFCSDVVDYRGGRGPPTQANQGHDACKAAGSSKRNKSPLVLYMLDGSACNQGANAVSWSKVWFSPKGSSRLCNADFGLSRPAKSLRRHSFESHKH